MKNLQIQTMEADIRKGITSYSDPLEKTFASTVNADPLEVININSGFLLALIRLIDEFTLTEINKNTYGSENAYTEHLFRITRSMLRLLSCKMQPDRKKDFKDRINNVLIKMGNISVGNDGDYINPKVSFQVESDIGEIFESLISYMEAISMLTYKADDPNKAMAKFDD